MNDDKGNVVPIKREVGVLNGLNTQKNYNQFWIVLGITIGAGILGGFVAELINLNGNIELPHRPSNDEWALRAADTGTRDAQPKDLYDLGILARLGVGGLAAPAAIVFLNPASIFALFGMSVVAGSAGTAIFIALQERIRTVIAEQRNAVSVAVAEREKEIVQEPLRQAKLKQSARLILGELENVSTKLGEVEKKLREGSETVEEEPNVLKFSKDKNVALKQNDFNEVWKPLNEVKGIDKQIGDKITAPFKILEQTIKSKSKSPEGGDYFVIKKGEQLDVEVFNQVKKCINEVKGEIKAIAALRSDRTNVSIAEGTNAPGTV
ncbi:hypothetical protein NDI45_16930 [Leptolyngbya sp. GB1-A1]|uniref:hypothetical protein n=1 Tax=Leptolyngbya sp. GB1-A1 TaxID=2933908 RepID=UPI003299EEA6